MRKAATSAQEHIMDKAWVILALTLAKRSMPTASGLFVISGHKNVKIVYAVSTKIIYTRVRDYQEVLEIINCAHSLAFSHKAL